MELTDYLRIVRRHEVLSDVMDAFLNMVRSPEMVALDINSMIACNNVARERMLSLVEKYGYDTVDNACQQLIEQSERQLRQRERALVRG